MSEEQKSGFSGFVSNVQKQAGEIAENIKDKVEDIVGEEKVKKATDFLNTDVGVIARDSSGKAMDAVENVAGRDLDNDGDIGGKPKV